MAPNRQAEGFGARFSPVELKAGDDAGYLAMGSQPDGLDFDR